MQKELSITCTSSCNKQDSKNFLSNWENTAQTSPLPLLRLARWTAITGSLSAVLSLLAGVANADTSGSTSGVSNIGTKAFSPSNVTTDAPAYKYEIRNDIKLNPYDWNINAASCNNSYLSDHKLVSANTKQFTVLATNVLPNSCLDLNFDGFTVESFDALEEIGYQQ
jgi:hypothetical protein